MVDNNYTVYINMPHNYAFAYMHIQVQRICKVMSYAKSLLPGPPHLQEEPALTEVSMIDGMNVIVQWNL